MNNKIYFSIPDFWNYYQLNAVLLDLMHDYKDQFYDNIIIDSVYGSFPCIWNGGRYIEGCGTLYGQDIYEIIKSFNKIGISVRHTFTNNLLTEEHLNDALGNLILQNSTNDTGIKNGITIALPILREYISKKYPDYYFVNSTTVGISDIDELNKISESTITIPYYGLNNNFEELKKLKHPENIELLVGETCIDNCPNRVKHHEWCSEAQLQLVNEKFNCPYARECYEDFYSTITARKHSISMEDIQNKYLPLGFNKFKISGRNDFITNVAERYIYYLVKPEYKDNMRLKMLNLLIH